MVVTITVTSCEKDVIEDPDIVVPNDPLAPLKKYTYDLMTDIYYWYKNVPNNIDPKPIKTIHAYFDTLLVKSDKWSWMMTGQEYLNSEAGIVESYGISLGQPVDFYNDYSVRVRYVHPNSPMAENGIKRGYQLSHLNGIPVNTLIANGTFNNVYNQKTNQFTFVNNSGENINFTASARQINTRSSLVTRIFTSEDYPGLPYNVGYFHYLTFRATMLDDINMAMAQFKAAGVEELILDLRYNGGGDGRATTLLANYLAPESANKAILAKREHNDRYRSWDSEASTQTVIERMNGSLNLKRLFIITGRGTASASEVILNGLSPLMNVVHIGNTTYGKPNGMYVLPYPEGNYDAPQYVFLPVCFFTVNSAGYGHYVDGIVPQHYRPDDLYNDFGVKEDLIKSALQYITTGSFPALPSRQQTYFTGTPGKKIALPEDSPGYGVYKVIP